MTRTEKFNGHKFPFHFSAQLVVETFFTSINISRYTFEMDAETRIPSHKGAHIFVVY